MTLWKLFPRLSASKYEPHRFRKHRKKSSDQKLGIRLMKSLTALFSFSGNVPFVDIKKKKLNYLEKSLSKSNSVVSSKCWMCCKGSSQLVGRTSRSTPFHIFFSGSNLQLNTLPTEQHESTIVLCLDQVRLSTTISRLLKE